MAAGDALMDLLSRLIDTNSQFVQGVAKIDSSLRENTSKLEGALNLNSRDVEEIFQLLQSVDGHFTNGFRSEIILAITKVIESTSQKHKEELDRIILDLSSVKADLKNLNSVLTTPFFWIKLIAALIVAIGTIAACIITVTTVLKGNGFIH